MNYGKCDPDLVMKAPVSRDFDRILGNLSNLLDSLSKQTIRLRELEERFYGPRPSTKEVLKATQEPSTPSLLSNLEYVVFTMENHVAEQQSLIDSLNRL